MNANPDTDVVTDATVRAINPMPLPATKKSRDVLVRRDAQMLIPIITAK
jgi:hypothetical protein